MKLASHILSFFFPDLCLSCRTVLPLGDKHSFCSDCKKGMRPLKSPFCLHCGDPFLNSEIESHRCGTCLSHPPPFEKARSVFLLSEELTRMIHRFKYQGSETALGWFGDCLVDGFNRLKDHTSFDWIVPVPLHPFRLRKRGYNQSLLLAKQLQKHLHIPLETKNLIRCENTKSQVGKSREERAGHMAKAFSVKHKENFSGKNILLLDDVYTTGATLRGCAKALQKAGAQVYGLTLARTPLL